MRELSRMIDSYPERLIDQTPENYRELQTMVFHADTLFLGRNGAWLGSQAVLLAIAVAQFKEVPFLMVLFAGGYRRADLAFLVPRRKVAGRSHHMARQRTEQFRGYHPRTVPLRSPVCSVPTLGISHHDHRSSDDARGRMDPAGNHQVRALNGHGRKPCFF